MPVLLRPDGAVQVGWDPRRAVLVRPPSGLTPGGLAAVLRSMRSPVPLIDLHRQANGEDLTELLQQLVNHGVARREPATSTGRTASIRVHGRGPLSDLLVSALRSSGVRTGHSSQPHAAVSTATVDLVVLADYLVADPRIVRDLHSSGVPHLPVRVRDGTGLVGPLVIPGVTRLPELRRPTPPRPRRSVAGHRRTVARHRWRGRPRHPAGDGGAGTQPGQSGDRRGPRPAGRCPVVAQCHAGIRPERQRDRGTAVDTASPVRVLTAPQAQPSRPCSGTLVEIDA